jgi:hypothetical protein
MKILRWGWRSIQMIIIAWAAIILALTLFFSSIVFGNSCHLTQCEIGLAVLPAVFATETAAC